MKIHRIPVLAIVVALSVASMFGQHAHSPKDAKTVQQKTGVLLLAHGGKQSWNDEVQKIASDAGKTMRVEVAFGMASKRTIQQAIDKLVADNVNEIVAVPLFVSSHSTVITSTEYLLGLRKVAPKDLAIFAKMDHGHAATAAGHGGHGSESSDKSFDPTTPIKSTVPIRMVSALNDDPVVADILLTRAASISSQPKDEVVIVVAHGPVSDEENQRWIADMKSLAGLMREKSDFKRIEYLTVRDDAPEPLRSRATAELRSLVERATGEKSRALIVPLLLSYGGIEEGVRKRLEGLSYTMTSQALLPDDRITRWVIRSAESSGAKRSQL